MCFSNGTTYLLTLKEDCLQRGEKYEERIFHWLPITTVEKDIGNIKQIEWDKRMTKRVDRKAKIILTIVEYAHKCNIYDVEFNNK